MCGIYLITNLVNGKQYVGQSNDIEYRWEQHKKSSTNKHKRSRLISAFKKYGIDNFKFEILELCSPDELDAKEIQYIAKYDTYNNGYNMTIGGDGQSGYGKSVKQYSLAGEFIQEFQTIELAHKVTGAPVSGIVNCCAKRRKQAGNFMWCYSNESIDQPYKDTESKEVDQYDFDGKFIRTFSSLGEAAKIVKKTRTQISACCRKTCGSCAGFLWRFHGDEPPAPYYPNHFKILQYSLDGELLGEYRTGIEASKSTGIGRTSIVQCYTGTIQTAGGFKWVKQPTD